VEHVRVLFLKLYICSFVVCAMTAGRPYFRIEWNDRMINYGVEVIVA
jgi:hypothetical protein